MPEKTEIRHATLADQSAIVQFQVEMARETERLELDPVVVEAGVNAVIEDPLKGMYYVACLEGRVIGSMMITNEWSDWRNGNIWWLQSVYILPEFRKNGIFRLMFEFLQRRVTEKREAKGIRLYVDRQNQDAQKVYSRLGMVGDHYLTFEWLP